jgi:hypothetical protein
MGSVKGPYIEVPNTIMAVKEVQRCTLAKCDGDTSMRQHMVLGVPSEELLAIQLRDQCEAS